MGDVIININADGEVKTQGLPVKVKKKKLQNGTETILEMPEAQENTNPSKAGILNLMGF